MLALVLPHGPVAFHWSSVAAPQLALTWRARRLSSALTASLSYGVLPAGVVSLCTGALETCSCALSSLTGVLGDVCGVESSSADLSLAGLSLAGLSLAGLSRAGLSLAAVSISRPSAPLTNVPSGPVPVDSSRFASSPHS